MAQAGMLLSWGEDVLPPFCSCSDSSDCSFCGRGDGQVSGVELIEIGQSEVLAWWECWVRESDALVGGCWVRESDALVGGCWVRESDALVGGCWVRESDALVGGCWVRESDALVGGCWVRESDALFGGCWVRESDALVGGCDTSIELNRDGEGEEATDGDKLPDGDTGRVKDVDGEEALNGEDNVTVSLSVAFEELNEDSSPSLMSA